MIFRRVLLLFFQLQLLLFLRSSGLLIHLMNQSSSYLKLKTSLVAVPVLVIALIVKAVIGYWVHKDLGEFSVGNEKVL